MAGDVANFYNMPSVLLILPTSIAFGIGATSLSTAKQAMQLCFVHKKVQKSELDTVILFFRTVGSSALYLGLAALFFALISIGANFTKIVEGAPESIGYVIAITATAPFYAACVKAVCFVFEQRLNTKKVY